MRGGNPQFRSRSALRAYFSLVVYPFPGNLMVSEIPSAAHGRISSAHPLSRTQRSSDLNRTHQTDQKLVIRWILTNGDRLISKGSEA